MKESAVVYRNFMQAVKKLPPEKQGEAYEAYLMYAYDGQEYEGDDCTITVLLECFRAQLDSDREKYQAQVDRARTAAAKRGKSETTSDNIVTTSYDIVTTSHEVDGVNVNVNVNDIEKKNTPKGVQKEKVQKHRFGEREKVLLTDEEYARLIADYGESQANAAVDYLDEYIERKGYKAKSHYLAIRKWVFDAMHEEEVKRQEIARREERLKERASPKRGHFAGERKDDIDGEVLSGAIRRITADGNEDDRDRPREAAGRDW